MVCLSTTGEVVAYHELTRGTVDFAVAHPRDVYRTAVLANASSVIVGHNHPSGDPSPSADDVELTRRLAAAGVLIGIPLADHVIVTAEGRVLLVQGIRPVIGRRIPAGGQQCVECPKERRSCVSSSLSSSIWRTQVSPNFSSPPSPAGIGRGRGVVRGDLEPGIRIVHRHRNCQFAVSSKEDHL